MNKQVIALSAALAVGIAGPVAAADSQTVEGAPADKAAVPQRVDDTARPWPVPRCHVEPLVLPLDHGPRAQSTPYLNRLRTERHEARVKACAGAAK